MARVNITQILLSDHNIITQNSQTRDFLKVQYIWKSSFFKKLIFVGVQLLYNVVLVSTVQQNRSATYIYIYTLPFGLPSHSGHHSALSRVPCAIQYVLINYLFYTQYQQRICVNPDLPIPPTSPLVSVHFLSMSVSLFLLCK